MIVEPSPFLAAEQQCIALGGNLVTISSDFENYFVSGIAAHGNSGPSYWIGANLLLSSSWTWTNSHDFKYSNWAAQQPSEMSASRCGAVQYVDNTWL